MEFSIKWNSISKIVIKIDLWKEKIGEKENNVATDDFTENATKLKVCGIRSITEINELKTLDIDYFGCIFAKSARQVDTELAAKIARTAHRHSKNLPKFSFRRKFYAF